MGAFIVTDRVLQDIQAHIGDHAPERGGALFVFPWTNWVVDFLYDAAALTTRATYSPSRELIDGVRRKERDLGLRFAGIIHSHPGGSDQPSGPDHSAFRSNLDHNLHLPAFLAPILTADRPADPANEHETAMTGSVRLTNYVAYRPQGKTHDRQPHRDTLHGARDGAELLPVPPDYVRADDQKVSRWIARSDRYVDVHPTTLTVMPVLSDLDVLGRELEAHFDAPVARTKSAPVGLGGTHFITEIVECGAGSLTLMIPVSYPASGPIVLFTPHGDDEDAAPGPTSQLSFDWPMRMTPDQPPNWSGLISAIETETHRRKEDSDE